MKALKIIGTLFFLFNGFSGFSQKSQASAIEQARQSLVTLMEEEAIIGLAVTVMYEDSIIWSEGLGYSDLNKSTPIQAHQTLFRIASLSKPITATILGRLYEEEVLNFNESVYRYVPDFPEKKYDIKIRHLATHSSGIRHYRFYDRENRKALSIEEGLRKFQRSRLSFEPGTDYLYSSYAYNLLGVAMEKASQKSFSELMHIYITQPLDMNNTIADNGIYDTLQVSGFFQSNGKNEIKKAKPVYMATKLPSGGMLSSSEDLAKFGNSYAYNSLLKEATQEIILSELILPDGRKTGYGMGWGIKVDQKGRKIISHTGGNTGSVCRIIVIPELKLTVAVVSNTFGIDWLKFIRTVNKIPNTILEGTKQNQGS